MILCVQPRHRLFTRPTQPHHSWSPLSKPTSLSISHLSSTVAQKKMIGDNATEPNRVGAVAVERCGLTSTCRRLSFCLARPRTSPVTSHQFSTHPACRCCFIHRIRSASTSIHQRRSAINISFLLRQTSRSSSFACVVNTKPGLARVTFNLLPNSPHSRRPNPAQSLLHLLEFVSPVLASILTACISCQSSPQQFPRPSSVASTSHSFSFA